MVRLASPPAKPPGQAERPGVGAGAGAESAPRPGEPSERVWSGCGEQTGGLLQEAGPSPEAALATRLLRSCPHTPALQVLLGLELSPPVTFQLRAGSGPVFLSGQESHGESRLRPRKV